VSTDPATQAPAQAGSAPTSRTLVLTVPDWPALAAGLTHGLPPTTPIAVLAAGRIHTANAPARTAGVLPGMTKRAARARLPHLTIHPRDTEAEHRTFATAVTVLEDLVARFTLLRPGTITVPLHALPHHHSEPDAYPDAHPGTGEAGWVEHLLIALTDRTGWEVFAGVADSTFAALLAAETSQLVPPGHTADFLAGQPIDELARLETTPPTLTDTLHALGLHTLGALAELPAAQVFERFAAAGLRAWHLAAGHEDRLPIDHARTREHHVGTHLEPPSANTDVLSFTARTLATDFLTDIRATGHVCTQIGIGLHTVTGALQQRTWRLETMDENTIADRIRWQSQSLLTDVGTTDPAPEDADGITTIELTAVELCAPLETQTSLFDTSTGHVSSTLERIQGLFGTDAVRTPGIQGGLDAAETNLWTPWQQTPAGHRSATAPWPGHLPTPTPLMVGTTPVHLTDATGTPVTARPDGLDTAPAWLHATTGRHAIAAHSAPWPVEARWWEPAPLYHVRLQVLLDTGEALLLTCTAGTWHITGSWT
jgi:protein ImuB